LKIRYSKKVTWIIAILVSGTVFFMTKNTASKNDILSRASISETALLFPACIEAGLSPAEIREQQNRIQQFVDLANTLGIFDSEECDESCLDCLTEMIEITIRNSRNSP